MIITATDVGRKFNRQWVFRHFTGQLESGQSYVFTGPNGSGKSTVLQILAGVLPVTEGEVTYAHQGKTVAPEHIFRYLVMAAPYLELIEEFTLAETLRFHARFKPFKGDSSVAELAERFGLAGALHKPVRYFSSGMKQRLKLGLAFFSDTPVLLLDEPTTNLDAQGVAWYHQHVLEHSQGRLLIVCSNQPSEYSFCQHVMDVTRL